MPRSPKGRAAACELDARLSTLSCLLEMLHSKQLRSIKMHRGENPAPGKDVHGELDRTPGIRERPRPKSNVLWRGQSRLSSPHG